ncbi:MAG: sulfite exporter TauE/SafE family protein [Chitinophagaceae bacterium]|nr:sulfite exporter TauE/SafE family protein [Chitinophagaceae bacterium]
MIQIPDYLFPLIFIAALLYASVGHGGASGYLALMGIIGVNLQDAKPVALILNCIVAIIAFIQFYRGGYFNRRLFIILAIASVPCAYLGGMITIEDHLYKRILGVVLLVSSFRFLLPSHEEKETNRPSNVSLLATGGGIGFLSGLIGIGGGIILTPLLLLMRWSKIKEAACVSALFIFVNSMSGLTAQIQKGIRWQPDMFIMITSATLGGLIGSYYGAKKWNTPVLKILLSVVLLIASFKLILI